MTRKTLLFGTGAMLAIAVPTTADAQQRSFHLPAQPATRSIPEFARQAGIQIVAPGSRLRGIRTREITGQQDVRAALRSLIEGTGLRIVADDGSTITLGMAPGTPNPTPTVRFSPSSAGDGVNSDSEDIVVTATGTRIRGGLTPSKVISIAAEQMREEGFTNLGEVIRNIPQNFSGGQNPGVSSGNISGAGIANQNLTGGSGLNLRGLGPDATLTLVNGRRLAYGGFVQSVDISAIPMAAVERVEIVADGASAIYGSDAVGGVGNIILKRDFEGLTAGARVGTATDGGLTTQEYTATAGTRWSSGGFIATYQDTSTDPIHARQRSYASYLIEPTTLYPESRLRSGLISGHQQLGRAVSVQLDGLRTRRHQSYSYTLSGSNAISTRTTTTLLSPSVAISLPMDWTVTIGGAWGKDEHLQYQTRTNVTTGATTVVSDTCYCNESRSYEASAEGPLFALGGGDARLAIGGGYRTIDFEQRNRSTGAATVEGRESAKFAYAEINLPLIGPQSDIDGVRRLTVTAAVRGEDYDSFGSIATPKIGLVYEPNADFSLKASWGKSFKAPTLLQRYQTKFAYLYPPTPFGGTGYPAGATVLVNFGGNTDLKPERAETWSASLAFHPAQAPAFEAELTGFYIDYVDRVVQPVANSAQSLSNPIYAQFIEHAPTAARQAEILASVAGFFNFANAAYDPSKVAEVINLQYLNAARQKIKGIDLSGSYRMELAGSRVTARGSASWLDSSQRVSAAQAPYDLAGTLFNPAKFTARLGAVWDRGGLSASAFVNYKGGVRDMVRQETTASFTTVDATIRYRTSTRGDLLSGIDIAFSIQNIFDQAPPLYRPTTSAASALPYDSTNYSAIGRFVSLSVAKHF